MLDREEDLWAQTKELTEHGVCAESPGRELAARKFGKTAAASTWLLRGPPGPALRLSPCLQHWQEETVGSLGTRTAGRGRDVVTFFPALHGKEMTSLLHKWDFLCSWKIDINAVFDNVSPGGTGPPQQPGVLTASPAALHKSPATVPLARRRPGREKLGSAATFRISGFYFVFTREVTK